MLLSLASNGVPFTLIAVVVSWFKGGLETKSMVTSGADSMVIRGGTQHGDVGAHREHGDVGAHSMVI